MHGMVVFLRFNLYIPFYILKDFTYTIFKSEGVNVNEVLG